jgi:flavin-dependent dehydrogenase
LKRAINNGSEVRNCRFEGFKYLNDYLEIKTNKGKFKSKLLVGADGANSLVAKKVGLKQPENLLIGVQTTVKGSFDTNSVELWFGSVAPNFFAWVVPENRYTARIGLATKTNCKHYFDLFLKKRLGVIKKADAAGTIKFGIMKETTSERILLVGDATCMIKPFSGGGIIYGLIASEQCANACIKALEKNEFSKKFLMKEYDKKWKSILKKPIKKGLRYRKIFDNLSDWQLDLFFNITNKLRLTKILESFDMDLLKND